MSSYIRRYYNQATNKSQDCLCIDDYFGQHEYGYLFKKDGSDATFDDFRLIADKKLWDIYNWEELHTLQDKEVKKRATKTMSLKDCS